MLKRIQPALVLKTVHVAGLLKTVHVAWLKEPAVDPSSSRKVEVPLLATDKRLKACSMLTYIAVVLYHESSTVVTKRMSTPAINPRGKRENQN